MTVSDVLKAPISVHLASCETAAAGAEGAGARIVSITVPGEIGFRGLVSRTVAAVCTMACTNHPAGNVFRDQVVSAVGEAFNNAVLHAYASTRGDVCLTIAFDLTQVVIELVESGMAFSPAEIPEFTCDEPHESGMGLFIIRRFVDDLLYTAGPPNRWRMVKRLPQP